MRAVVAAVDALSAGSVDPIDCAVRGVVVLEDDPDFNAGTGSNLRLDGRTVEMDAAVMDSSGRFGAVGAIQGVRNPVLVARAVADSAQLLLVGQGAVAFAREHGQLPYDPTTPGATTRYRTFLGLIDEVRGRSALATPSAAAARDGGMPPLPPTRAPAPRHSPRRDAGASDTVAILVRSASGRFGGAASSGGPALASLGRVGPVCVPGGALYVGPKGATAVTGEGDAILRANLARVAYDELVRTGSTKDAVERTLGQLTDDTPAGVAAVDADTSYIAATRPMAWATWTPSGESTADGAGER